MSAQRYYCTHSMGRGAWMEPVHPNRPTEVGHYYTAADYAALSAENKRLREVLDALVRLWDAERVLFSTGKANEGRADYEILKAYVWPKLEALTTTAEGE